MIGNRFIVISIAVLAAFFTVGLSFAQVSAEKSPVSAVQADQSKEASIYGEVKSVDAVAGTISVQYYDYDSDEERTADIAVGSTTKVENVPAIGDIKQGDWVDVTYNTTGGKGLATFVSVEKEEAVSDMQADYEPTAPDEE